MDSSNNEIINNQQEFKLTKANQVMFELINFFTPLVCAIFITGHYMRENNLRPIFCAFIIAISFSFIFIITSIKKVGDKIIKGNGNITIANSKTKNIINAEEIKSIEARNFSAFVIISLNNGKALWSLNYSINIIALLIMLCSISPIVAIPFIIQRSLYTKGINDFIKNNIPFNLKSTSLIITNIFCWLSCVYITFWGVLCLIVNHIIISEGWLFK